MTLNDLLSKKIAILGFGQEGRALANYFKKQKISFSILDQKPISAFTKQELLVINKLTNNYCLGESYLDRLFEFEIIFRSPGVKRNLSKIKIAEKKGIIFSSLTQLFFDLCPARIIAVTGTKGKGTTSTLIWKILNEAGKKCFLAGNIGKPPIDYLQQIKNDDLVVLELSSFQLIDLNIHPEIAVVLMITSEHLDWHQNQSEYLKAKINLIKRQAKKDFAVFAIDYPNTVTASKFTNAKKYFFSTKKTVKNGVYLSADNFIFIENNFKKVICKTSDVKLPGRHNLENVTAALTVASILSIDKKLIKKALSDFTGLAHRLEFVSKKKEVLFFDDSISTTPETTIAAIRSFSNPMVLIIGGSSKNSNYTDLGLEIAKSKKIKALILVGETARQIEESILKVGGYQGKIVKGCKNMTEIVNAAVKLAERNNIVMLSPACASFGMFENYKDRGNQFKNEVLSLPG